VLGTVVLAGALKAAKATTYYTNSDQGIMPIIDDPNVVDGDEIVAAEGTYVEQINFKGKNITLRSTQPDDPDVVAATVIDGRYWNRSLVIFDNGEGPNSLLNGFTIARGLRRGSGAGINCASDPTIINCVIKDCLTTSDGAGMSNEGSPILINCLFLNNRADTWSCGGMLNRGGSPTLINCMFIGNYAPFGTGGIGNSDGGNLTLINCTISGNSTDGEGGGMYNYGSSATLINCLFTGNSASGQAPGEAGGGAIHNYQSSLTLSNCTFSNNWALDEGGGMFSRNSDTITLSNCIFSNNTDSGGTDASAQLYNDNSTVVTTYSNVQGGWPGEGNIDADPCFIAPGYWGDANDPNIIVEPNDPNAAWVAGDYHLPAGSPCINAGDPNYPYDPNETDLDGRRRIVSGRIDMGAYEFLGLIYVDDDAPNDPGSYDPNISDPLENGSQSHPFDTVQEAIDAAVDNDSVGVRPGLYTESTDFLGKAITVTGVDGAAVLQSPGDYAVSFYHGEDADSIFKNFVVRNSFAGFLVLVGSPTIKNVTVVNNGTAVVADDGAAPNISNSIFWNNTSGDLFQCQARYSCIESDGNGPSNISQDPLFVDPNGDYHLKSEGWRWNENVGGGSSWTWDAVTSRCIDAGNPGSPLDSELLTIPRDPDNVYGINVRINMGAYGGTAEASMGPHDWAFLADLNSDGVVNFLDFAEQAEDWQTNGNEYPGDLNWDGTVNMPDCKVLAEDWLQATDWAQ